MQTAAIQVSLPETVLSTLTGHDPMETRWAIQCGARDKNTESWKTGFVGLPFGEFFRVARFDTMEEIHSTDDNPNFPRTRNVVRPADDVELYLSEMLGGTDSSGNIQPGKPDFGIRFGFRGETDGAKVAVISATLLPTLPYIRQFAASNGYTNPIGDRCDGQDLGDFTDRDSCPTCWSKWIKSDLCDKYIAIVIEQGMECDEYNPNTRETTTRTVRPTAEEFAQGRQMAIEALTLGLQSMQAIWTTLVDEMEKGERRGMDPYQHRIRRDVHGTKPQDKQVEMMREFGRASAGNGDGGNSEIMAALAASALRTETMLAEILGARSTGTLPVIPGPTEAPAKPAAKTGGK